jgi:hypothetical protein
VYKPKVGDLLLHSKFAVNVRFVDEVRVRVPYCVGNLGTNGVLSVAAQSITCGRRAAGEPVSASGRPKAQQDTHVVIPVADNEEMAVAGDGVNDEMKGVPKFVLPGNAGAGKLPAVAEVAAVDGASDSPGRLRAFATRLQRPHRKLSGTSVPSVSAGATESSCATESSSATESSNDIDGESRDDVERPAAARVASISLQNRSGSAHGGISGVAADGSAAVASSATAAAAVVSTAMEDVHADDETDLLNMEALAHSGPVGFATANLMECGWLDVVFKVRTHLC